MTKEEKARVSELRSQGLSVKDIAQVTGMPLNTVKSFCYRNPVEPSAEQCRQCGKEIRQTPGARRKNFCSDSCRLRWWNSHPEQVSRTTKTHVCPQCGQSFESHVDRQQYCSRACYAAARRKGAVR